MIGCTAYAATKAAFEAHTINLAAELAGTGVTANAEPRHRLRRKTAVAAANHVGAFTR